MYRIAALALTALLALIALAAPAAACIILIAWEVDDILHDLPPCASAMPPEQHDDEEIRIRNDCADPLQLASDDVELGYNAPVSPGHDRTVPIWTWESPTRGGQATTRYTWTLGDDSGEIIVQQHLDPYDPDEICGLCSTTVGAVPSGHGLGWLLGGLFALGVWRRRAR